MVRRDRLCQKIEPNGLLTASGVFMSAPVIWANAIIGRPILATARANLLATDCSLASPLQAAAMWSSAINPISFSSQHRLIASHWSSNGTPSVDQKKMLSASSC